MIDKFKRHDAYYEPLLVEKLNEIIDVVNSLERKVYNLPDNVGIDTPKPEGQCKHKSPVPFSPDNVGDPNYCYECNTVFKEQMIGGVPEVEEIK